MSTHSTDGPHPSDEGLERRASRAENDIVETIDEIQRRLGGATEAVEEVADEVTEHQFDLPLVAALGAGVVATACVWAMGRATSPVALRGRVLREIVRLFPVRRVSTSRRLLRGLFGTAVVLASGWGARFVVGRALEGKSSPKPTS